MFIGGFTGVTPTFVQLANVSYSDFAIDPANANQLIQFNNSGWVQDNGVNQQTWLLIGSATDYELFVHNNGPDALVSGTLDTWLSLSSTRTYQLEQTVVGSKQAVLTAQIRLAATGQVLASADFTLNVLVDA